MHLCSAFFLVRNQMKFIYLGILLLVLAFCGMPVQWATNSTEASLCVLDTNAAFQNSSNDDKELPKKKEEKEDKEDKEEKEDDRNEEEETKDKYSTLKSVYDGFNAFEFTKKINAHFARYEHDKVGKAIPAAPLYILYSNLKISC